MFFWYIVGAVAYNCDVGKTGNHSVAMPYADAFFLQMDSASGTFVVRAVAHNRFGDKTH